MAISAGPFETVLLAELRLGLPPVFYWRLYEIEDDWAFILKLHSLFEGALTRLVKEKLTLRELRQESLTPYDSFFSRVQLADRLELLDPDYKNYFLALNHLRNDITHNIRHINLRLPAYFDSLAENDFRRATRGLGAGFKNLPLDVAQLLKPLLELKKSKYTPKTVRDLFMCLSPKFTIWHSGIYALDLISLHFHFEIVGDSVCQEAEMEAKLQDLLLDPEVIAFKKKLAKKLGGSGLN
jgi:hypothetical protein